MLGLTKTKIYMNIKIAISNYNGPVRTTLVGWIRRYDDQGRSLNADPNTTSVNINVGGILYHIKKKSWITNVYSANRELLFTFDDTPDYIKDNTVY